MKRFTVKEWMTTEPITITSNKTIPQAYWTMVDKKIRRLLVMDKGNLVGIVTIDDLRQKIPYTTFAIDAVRASDTLSKLPVNRVMTKNPITVPIDTELVDAAKIMIKNHISTLPVLEEDYLVGLITEGDIFRAFVELFEITCSD